MKIRYQKCFQAYHRGLAKAFVAWATLVARFPGLVLAAGLSIVALTSIGLKDAAALSSNEQTAAYQINLGAESEFEKSKAVEAELGFTVNEYEGFSVIIQAKEETLLTKQAFAEMIDFHEGLIRMQDSNSDQVLELCLRLEDARCVTSAKPIDFTYSLQSYNFDLSQFDSDADLVARVQSGISQKPLIFSSNPDLSYLNLKDLFGRSITPKETFFQDHATGQSNIESAKATFYSYRITSDEDQVKDKEQIALDIATNFIDNFNKQAQHIEVLYMGVSSEMNKQLLADSKYVVMAITLILVYCMVFLGSCSPIHCRATLALIGIFCILFATAFGFGICFFAGYKTTSMSMVIPVMILAIGVDDMFVLCNAVDQQPFHLPSHERLRRGLRHAGPSVTLTSLTDFVAFIVGTLSQMKAFRIFSTFSGVTVFALYVVLMTVFMPCLFWDLQRIEKRKKACCGLCFCKEESAFWCKGKLLTEHQKRHSSTECTTLDTQEGQVNSDEKICASQTEIFIQDKLSVWLLSPICKIGLLLLFGAMTTLTIIAVQKSEVNYSNVALITDEEAPIYKVGQAVKNYFPDKKEIISVMVNNTSHNFASEESQLSMLAFEDALYRCENCERPWTSPGTLISWQSHLRQWIDQGNCEYARWGFDPFKKVLEEKTIKLCVQQWQEEPEFKFFERHLKMSENEREIEGYKFTFKVSYAQLKNDLFRAQALLRDLDRIVDIYGPTQSTIRTTIQANVEFELNNLKDIARSIAVALAFIVSVVMLVTMSLRVALFVVIAMFMIDFYLYGLMHLWGLSLNVSTAIHFVFALGLAVDQTTHIVFYFLHSEVPKLDEAKSNREKRNIKARAAISEMGSSVLHGCVSSLVGVSVIAPSENVLFQVTFKMWFGMISIGILIGCFLLPVVLSEMGPVGKTQLRKNGVEEEREVEVSTIPIQTSSKEHLERDDLVSERNEGEF